MAAVLVGGGRAERKRGGRADEGVQEERVTQGAERRQIVFARRDFVCGGGFDPLPRGRGEKKQSERRSRQIFRRRRYDVI